MAGNLSLRKIFGLDEIDEIEHHGIYAGLTVGHITARMLS
jgi:hypothetical protein